MLICNFSRYCGHSMGVIPGLVSIPVVKSFCVLFVYYGFLWEFHFAASSLYSYISFLLQIFFIYLIFSLYFVQFLTFNLCFKKQLNIVFYININVVSLLTNAFGPFMREVDTVYDQKKPSIGQAASFEGYSRSEGYSSDDSRELVYWQNPITLIFYYNFEYSSRFFLFHIYYVYHKIKY